MALETVDQLTADWERLKRQKARYTGGIEGRVLLNLGFVLGEQYVSHRNQGIYNEVQDPNKLYLVFNIIKPRLGRRLGRLTAGAVNFTAVPSKRDVKAVANSKIVAKLDQAVDQKLAQPTRLWETLRWTAVEGTAFIHTPWGPDAITESMPV